MSSAIETRKGRPPLSENEKAYKSRKGRPAKPGGRPEAKKPGRKPKDVHEFIGEIHKSIRSGSRRELEFSLHMYAVELRVQLIDEDDIKRLQEQALQEARESIDEG